MWVYEEENICVKFLVGKMMQRNYPEDLGIDGILILKGIQKNKMEVCGMDASA